MSAMNPLGSLFDVVAGIVPLDLQTARNGDWVSLKNHHGALIVILKGQGTAGDDPTFTLQQATDVAGTGSKNASVISEYWTKQEAAANLEATGTWTRSTQSAAATLVGDGTSAESAALYAFYVPTDALDVDGGFDCIRLNCADTGGNPQLGCWLYILLPRQKAAPQNLLSSIAD